MTELAPASHPAGRRADVLNILRRATEPLTIVDIADRLGLHVNTVRFHLGTLVANGQVERAKSQPGATGRPAQLFRVVRGMDPMGPRHYQVLAEVLTASLATDPDPTGRATAAGRAWGLDHGSGLAATTDNIAGDYDPSVRRLTQLLDQLGFAPEENSSGDKSQILLRHCPFLELAKDNSKVICSVHLGLMRGAMESWNSSIVVERLDAFVQPNLCTAHLASAASS